MGLGRFGPNHQTKMKSCCAPWEDGGGRGERGDGPDEGVLAGEVEQPVFLCVGGLDGVGETTAVALDGRKVGLARVGVSYVRLHRRSNIDATKTHRETRPCTAKVATARR